MTNTQKEKNSSNKVTFMCGESLDVISVANLHQALKSALEKRRPFSLDLSKVERVDTSALQLLCAFADLAIESGLKFNFHEPSPPVYEAARTLGVETRLFPDLRGESGDTTPSEVGGLTLQPKGVG